MDCEPLADVAAQIDFDIKPLPAEAVEPMLMFHNASPPVSNDRFTEAVYGTTKQGAGVILWLRAGDVCMRDMIPPIAWVRLLPIIAGNSV